MERKVRQTRMTEWMPEGEGSGLNRPRTYDSGLATEEARHHDLQEILELFKEFRVKRLLFPFCARLGR